MESAGYSGISRKYGFKVLKTEQCVPDRKDSFMVVEQALKYFVPKLISVFLNDGIISRILDPIVRSFLGHL